MDMFKKLISYTIAGLILWWLTKLLNNNPILLILLVFWLTHQVNFLNDNNKARIKDSLRYEDQIRSLGDQLCESMDKIEQLEYELDDIKSRINKPY